jgi:hypothetical protein
MKGNLRVLGVMEIKTVPYAPWSHPFVERMIGTIRRECLDRLLFWTASDLETKLIAFRDYYNGYRSHAGLKGETPIATAESRGAILKSYRWQPHCRGLYPTPTAASARIRQGVRPAKAGLFSGSESRRGEMSEPRSLGHIREGNDANEAD